MPVPDSPSHANMGVITNISGGLMDSNISGGLVDTNFSGGLMDTNFSGGLMDANISGGLCGCKYFWIPECGHR